MMTDEEILVEAIQKAVDGGWDKAEGDVALNELLPVGISMAPIFIYNHDFAKALWGEAPEGQIGHEEVATLDFPGGGRKVVYSYHPWQEHLQQMVIAADPIKYLGENI